MKTFIIGDIHGQAEALGALLKKLRPDPRQDWLVFLGDLFDRGPDSFQVFQEVKRLAEELGLADRVVFAGHIGEADALNALYRRASLFLFPSQYDTSGLVVREAAAMGTPSVVVRGSSAAEGIRDGENGFLCADDPDDLARVIDAALSDRQALERVGRAALETIPIPWSKLVDDVLQKYAGLVRG